MEKYYPPMDYILYLIEEEGLIEDYNQFAENEMEKGYIPIPILLRRFYDNFLRRR